MLGGAAKSEQSATALQCLGAPGSPARPRSFVDANPIRWRCKALAVPRRSSWRYRGARHRGRAHDNVWYRVAAGGRLGCDGVGADGNSALVRPLLQGRPEPNLTPIAPTSARVLMPRRQQQTTPSSHQVQGRMAGLIGKDEYQ
jgi:hypothetical protein